MIQERQEGMRLIRPEQIRLLGPEAAVALIRDQNPVRLHKVRYFEDRELRKLDAQQRRVALAEPPQLPESPLPGELFPPEPEVKWDHATGGTAIAPEPKEPVAPKPAAIPILVREGGQPEKEPVPNKSGPPQVLERGAGSEQPDQHEGVDRILEKQKAMKMEIDLVSVAKVTRKRLREAQVTPLE